MNRLKGKVAILTGGRTRHRISNLPETGLEGARVAITDVLDRDGQQAAEEINASRGSARFWHLDVSREDEVRQIVRDIRDVFVTINILVNNAGISGANKPTHEITEQEWDHLMAINVKGVFFCTKHVVPIMKAGGGGSIINLSSIYGLIGAGDISPYHASKGAVRLMSKNDAILYAPDKIRVRE